MLMTHCFVLNLVRVFFWTLYDRYVFVFIYNYYLWTLRDCGIKGGAAVDHLALHRCIQGSIPAMGCIANGFPIHARSRRIFSCCLLPSKLYIVCLFVVCYVDVGTPLEISLTIKGILRDVKAK